MGASDMKLKVPKDVKILDRKVREVFGNYENSIRGKLLELRRLIMDEAGRHPEIGKLQETLKWGQPSYLPAKPRIGTTLRIDRHPIRADMVGLYFSCNSSLADDFQQLYPGLFEFEGRRAILISTEDLVHEAALRHCVALALTYHLNKKR